MLECAFLKCAFLSMPFFSQRQGGHTRISVISPVVRPEVGGTCKGGCSSKPSSPSMVYEYHGLAQTETVRQQLWLQAPACFSVSAAFAVAIATKLPFTLSCAGFGSCWRNCRLLQPLDWKVSYGSPIRQAISFHARPWAISALWESPALSPSRSWIWCFSLSQPAALCRSPFFYASSHCTGLETASRAKEGGQRHQHICPTAQLSPSRWGWSQKT